MSSESTGNITFGDSKYSKLAVTISKIVITAAIILYLINKIEYQKIKSALEGADYLLVASAASLAVLNIYLQYKKWQIICRNSLKIYDNKKILKSLFVGFSGGIVTPFKLGEFVARALPFKEVSLVEVTLATAVDKFFPLITVSFIGGVSAILFIHYFYAVSLFLTLGLLIVFLAFFYFFFILVNNRKFWNVIVYEKLSKIKLLKKHIAKLEMLGGMSPKVTWHLTFVTLLYYFTFTTQMALLIAAFVHQFDIVNYLWISNLVIFSQTIIPQVTIAELGIREGSTVFFMNLLGLSAAAGFNAAIILFFINLVLPAVAGAFLIISRNND